MVKKVRYVMNKYWIRTSMVFLILSILAACGSDDTNLTLVTDEREDLVREFVTDYKETMVDAYNTGNFNQLEPFLITNNSFYHSLRRYVSDSHSEGNTKDLLDFQVHQVFEDPEGDLYVDAIERVEVIEHGQANEVERDVRFELTKGGSDSFRIVTIRHVKS